MQAGGGGGGGGGGGVPPPDATQGPYVSGQPMFVIHLVCVPATNVPEIGL